MDVDSAIWFSGAAIGSVFLLKMMRRRQARLQHLLRDYVREQIEWLQKRSKASRMLQKAAKAKAKEEADFAEQLKEQPVQQKAAGIEQLLAGGSSPVAEGLAEAVGESNS